jgi:hypothetical protein
MFSIIIIIFSFLLIIFWDMAFLCDDTWHSVSEPNRGIKLVFFRKSNTICGCFENLCEKR